MSFLYLQHMRAFTQHTLMSHLYKRAVTIEPTKIPHLDDFMLGAKQAFLHVNRKLVVSKDLQELEKCFTKDFWQEVNKISGHFEKGRANHGELYKLDFFDVKPYVTAIDYNEQDALLSVDVEFFSEYAFRYEKFANVRRNSLSFVMKLDDAFPDWKIQASE